MKNKSYSKPASPKGASEYWRRMYERQCEEVPRQPTEKRFLELLGDGESITGSITILSAEYGISADKCLEMYEDLRVRCNLWELDNMLGISKT